MRKRGPDTFNEFSSLLLVLTSLAAALVVLLLLLTSRPLILLISGGNWDFTERQMANLFWWWCTPQVLFLAISTIATQICNSFGKFASAAWIPMLNSLTICLACATFLILDISLESGTQQSAAIMTLGAATLLGSVAQATALIAVARRLGWSPVRPRRMRGFALRNTVRTGLWAVSTAAMFQLANLVSTAVATQAGALSASSGTPGRGYSALVAAQGLLYVGQALLTANLATILLQRLSQDLADEHLDRARSRFRHQCTLATRTLIPFSMAGLVLGPLAGVALFSHGNTSAGEAIAIGLLFAILCAGLLPFGLHVVLLRPFYAMRLGAPGFVSALRICSVWIAGAIVSLTLLPSGVVVFGLAASFVFAYAMDMPLKARKLNSYSFKVLNVPRRRCVYDVLLTTPACLVAVILVHICLGLPSGRLLVSFFGITVVWGVIYVATSLLDPGSLVRYRLGRATTTLL